MGQIKKKLFSGDSFQSSQVPSEILDLFLGFLQTSNVTTEQYFDVDDMTGERILNREKVTTKQQDLKASLSFFERVYPQYFDPITQEKLEQLKLASSDSTADDIKKKAREIFEDTEN